MKSQPMSLRQTALGIVLPLMAGLDPGKAVRRGLRGMEPGRYRRIVACGAGKAAAAMARAVEQRLGTRLEGGCVVVKDGHGMPLQRVAVLEAAHPVPDERSLHAAAVLRDAVRDLGPDDLLIFLLSGGASALLEQLSPGLELSDLQEITTTLLRSGAAIGEVNAVRKHLSRIKGGQLASGLGGACALLLVLSDVLGNPLDVIGSGPLVGDPSTLAQAEAILRRYGLDRYVSYLVETPKPSDPAFRAIHPVIVGGVSDLVAAAARHVRSQGWHPVVLTTSLEGEARTCGGVLAAIAREVRDSGRPCRPPCCLIAGGETTVTVRGRGSGGRNQEMAMGFALKAAGLDGVVLAAAASDGTDGPTDAAGALADGTTIDRGRALGLDAQAALDDNDTYPYFDRLGDLVRTGPTRTNINDVYLVFIS